MAATVRAITVPIEAEFTGFTVRSGDTLLIRCNGPISEAHAETMKQKIRDRLPGVDVLVIQADGFAVYRPELVSDDDEHAG